MFSISFQQDIPILLLSLIFRVYIRAFLAKSCQDQRVKLYTVNSAIGRCIINFPSILPCSEISFVFSSTSCPLPLPGMLLDYWMSTILKISNVCWFQLLKCEDLLNVFVIYGSK